jgi:hypothetical protein
MALLVKEYLMGQALATRFRTLFSGPAKSLFFVLVLSYKREPDSSGYGDKWLS